MDQNRELADFGRQMESGDSPEIEPGGTIASRNEDRKKEHGEGQSGGHTRRPPHGRSHATIGR